jgi:hypothetical protein
MGGKLRGRDPERVDVSIGGGEFSIDGGGCARADADADAPGRKRGRGYGALGAGCADDKRSVIIAAAEGIGTDEPCTGGTGAPKTCATDA